MSAVTLETLLDDFHKKADALAVGRPPEVRAKFATPEAFIAGIKRLSVEVQANIWAGHNVDADARDVAMRAATYLVARDHGLEAAMLYKLSDGAIDPRTTDSTD